MNFDHFVQELKILLTQPLPGEAAQFRMAPAHRLTFKEYYERGKKNPKQSAVLICFYPHHSSVFTVLILRPSAQGVHSDQVSFPGGKFENDDIKLEATALREAQEEIGLIPSEIEILGRLTAVYIPVSNYMVQPIVGVCRHRQEFQLNEQEVLLLLETDCRTFLDESIKGDGLFKTGDKMHIEAPFYLVQDHKIWGATAMMISELEEILRSSSTFN